MCNARYYFYRIYYWRVYQTTASRNDLVTSSSDVFRAFYSLCCSCTAHDYRAKQMCAQISRCKFGNDYFLSVWHPKILHFSFTVFFRIRLFSGTVNRILPRSGNADTRGSRPTIEQSNFTTYKLPHSTFNRVVIGMEFNYGKQITRSVNGFTAIAWYTWIFMRFFLCSTALI